MTEGVDSHSAVRYGPRRIVLYAGSRVEARMDGAGDCHPAGTGE